jgi:hypothetical protein
LLLWKIEEIAMGTLSKRRLDEFGVDVKQRIEELRRGVGKKLDGIGARVTTSSQPEGPLARGFGKVSSALPTSGWLGLAIASIAGSIGLKLAKQHTGATFVAAWVPTFLLLGLYNMNKAKPVPVAYEDDHGVH